MGMPGAAGQARAAAPQITRLRVALLTDQGVIDGGVAKIDPAAEEADGWVRVIFPFDEMRGRAKLPSARVRAIGVFADGKGSLYIARAWLVEEDQPLIADPGPRRRRVRVNQKVTFEAAPQAPGVRARYVWDFDDLDGFGEDALGRKVTWTFEEPRHYVVTLLVTDLAKQKVPKVAHVYVLVEK